MNTPEKYIKEAFDEVKMPENLKRATLDMIEGEALRRGELDSFTQPASSETLDPASNKNTEVAGASDDFSSTPSVRSRTRRPFSFTRKAGLAMAACLLLCAIGFGGLSAYATETALVEIELNPSIQLGVNRFDTVIDARALNEDGKRVLSEVSVVGKSYDEAINLLTQSDIFQSYIGTDSFVDISVICDDDRQSDVLVAQGQRSIDTLPCEGYCGRASSQTHSEAAEHGMGVGRYQVAQVLVDLDPSLTLKDCEAMSMKEMRMRIAELDPTNEYAWGQGDHDGMGSQGQGQGAHNGKGRGNHSDTL